MSKANVSGAGARAYIVGGLSDLGFFIFLSACVATCGWSPHRNGTPDAPRTDCDR